MGDAFMDKFNAFGERIKVQGAGFSRKMSAGVTSMSGKMKELFQVPTQGDKLVEDATAENLDGPDWVKNMQICDLVNLEQISGPEIVRALKKRLAINDSRVSLLTLFLLETCVKNCEKMFSEVAAERVLDEMVKTIDDPQSSRAVREKALKLIESWGESTEELRYLPVFEETYKSLKSRGLQFPGRDSESLAPIFTPPRSESAEAGVTGEDATRWESSNLLTPEQAKEVIDIARNSMELLSTVLTSSPQQEVLKEELTSTLVEQCRQSQVSIQKMIEQGDNEPLLFEALHVNDGLHQVLMKFEEMLGPTLQTNQPSEPALIPVGVVDEEDVLVSGEDSLVRKGSGKPSNFRSLQGEEAAMADLDEMIFGCQGPSQENPQRVKNKKNDDLIVF